MNEVRITHLLLRVQQGPQLVRQPHFDVLQRASIGSGRQARQVNS
jgi:hypothetical protein